MKRVLNKSFNTINRKYKELAARGEKGAKPMSADEWLLDNFYIIEQDVYGLREQLRHVPKREIRAFEKDTYIVLLAKKFLKKNELKLTLPELVSFLKKEQEKNPLRIAELWLFPSAIKIALISEIAYICTRGGGNVKMGNAIKSLISVRDIHWKERFDELCHVDIILSGDKTYPGMSFETKSQYRKAVTRISHIAGVSESKVADTAVKCAASGSGREAHVGYYLVDKGEDDLRRRLGVKVKKRKKNERIYILLAPAAATLICVFIGAAAKSIAGAVLAFVPVLEIVLTLINHVLLKAIPRRRVAEIELKEGIPDEGKTLVVYPVLLPSAKEGVEMAEKAEVCYLANKDDNLCFAILGDFKDSVQQHSGDDEEIILKTSEKIRALNEKYGQRFFLLHRERIFSEKQNKWLGRERKRGALADLNSFLRGGYTFKFSEGDTKRLNNIKYVITLDSDTFLPIGAAKKLVGAMLHPLNRPKIRDGIVKEGYGIIEPRVSTELLSANKSFFSRVYAGQGGVDTYSSTVADIYMDMFGEAVFTGKGIYDIDAFAQCMGDAIPDDTVLSHDLLEGSYCRCALASDIEVYDGYPSAFMSYASRMHRWIRGDWQISGWLLPMVRDRKNNRINNPLSALSKWKIFDNLRRSLTPAGQVLLLLCAPVLSDSPVIWAAISLLSLCLPMLLYFVDALLSKSFIYIGDRLNADIFYGAKGYVYQTTLKIAFLAYSAYMSVDAAVRGVVRQKSKKKTLEWVTADQNDKSIKDSAGYHYLKMLSSVIIGAAAILISLIAGGQYMGVAVIFGVIWAAAPLVACYSGQVHDEDSYKITEKTRKMLLDAAGRIWRFFDRYMNEGDNFLPPDNIQIQPYKGVAHRTSPTNIGLGMVAVVCARELGFISGEEAGQRLSRTVATIEKMEKWRGHLYNWYNTRTLAPLKPRYVSTVDSGNFACYLMVAAKSMEKDYPELAAKILTIADGMTFLPLYDKEKELFSIGYSVDENRLTNSYYDLLASEARQAGFLAVARGEVEPEHWFRLDRSLTGSDGYKGLVSWTGTMFEYLMPLLIMKSYKNSMLSETYWFALQAQKKYGHKRRVPWGVSESGYYSFDKDRNYQYKAFGIPKLGLKRGLSGDVVVTPYASFLALMVDVQSAAANIELLKKEGLYGEYGMNEAIDYRPDPSYGVKRGIVKSYMAHHQGMSLAALTNVLCGNILQNLFHSYACVRAAEPLLKERVPVKASISRRRGEAVEPVKSKWQTAKECVRSFSEQYALPPMHVLSNGAYTVVVDNRGNGYSTLDRINLNKFSFFGTGQSVYIKCTENATGWSGYGDKCVFSPHMAEFRAENENVETNLSLCVAPDDNAEIRRLTIINKSDSKKNFEIFFYCEVSLTTQAAQTAHNAFANLFVKTSYKDGVLYAERRKRDENDKTFTGFSLPLIESKSHASLQFETDRNTFVGRGRVPESPRAFYDSNALASGEGNVLDPCFAFKVSLCVEKGESGSVSFVSGMTDSMDAAVHTAEKFKNINPMDIAEDAYRAAKTQNLRLNLKEDEEKAFLNALPHIIYGGCPTGEREKSILQNKAPISELWKMGISGDVPIVLLRLGEKQDISVLEEMLRAHAYWRHKDIYTDLVILCDEPAGYTKPLGEEVRKRVTSGRNGIYVVTSDITEQDRDLLCAASKIYIDAARGGLAQITPAPKKPVVKKQLKQQSGADIAFDEPPEFYNGYGGFEGDEYVINQKMAGETPAPWINVVANPMLGFISGESGGGYTWRHNSRQNRLTAWNNDAVSDELTERLVITEGEDAFSPMAGAFDEQGHYQTRYGFGYTKYLRNTRNLSIEATLFTPVSDSVKLISIRLKNNAGGERKLKVSFSAEPVLGTDLFETRGRKRYFPLKGGGVGMQNAFSGNELTMFMSSSGETHHHLEDVISGISHGDTGGGYDAVVTVYQNILLPAGGEKIITFMLGAEKSREDSNALIEKYKNAENVTAAFDEAVKKEKDILDVIKVKTPSKSFDIMLGGRLLYQALACRITARSAFYQSSGAFGFRDQLQDSLALMYAAPDKAKKQILLHAAHQFEEGDVLHWWHEEEDRPDKGVRTRFSDDRLWLCYLVIDYISITGDKSILDERVNYLSEQVLADGEDERYTQPSKSQLCESIYHHCRRAIEASMKTGAHGLPLIGGGDWNDGMNSIGIEGSGESVWLAWFFADILNKFSKFTDARTAQRYKQHAQKITEAAEAAWDGAWYRRAYFDNGAPVGSEHNEECKIDSISQSWAVMSGGAEKQRAREAMDSVERLLIDHTHGIVKLLTPPFDKSTPSPGYIKSYPPGIRENGGQYTHAAVWVGIAFAVMGDGARAMKVFDLINPINHSGVQLLANLYKAEPYALAADVYGAPPHTGRGGWTWYTGAAAWMYRFGTEHLLGFKKQGSIVKFDPSLPDDWNEFTLEYRFINTPYKFNVKRGDKKSGEIRLVNDGKLHEMDVFF